MYMLTRIFNVDRCKSSTLMLSGHRSSAIPQFFIVRFEKALSDVTSGSFQNLDRQTASTCLDSKTALELLQAAGR
jgi:hypothetical protein